MERVRLRWGIVLLKLEASIEICSDSVRFRVSGMDSPGLPLRLTRKLYARGIETVSRKILITSKIMRRI